MRAFLPLLLLSGCLLCESPNTPRIARHALLGLGYHSIALGPTTLACFPYAGLEFEASTADGRPVSGVVCCGSSAGEVMIDGETSR